jgi:hypothetical protein
LAGYNKFFKQLWPILNTKEYTLIFVFVKENEIVLSGLIKMEPMQKMMNLANNCPKENPGHGAQSRNSQEEPLPEVVGGQ